MARSRPKLTFEIIDQSFVLPLETVLFGSTKPILGCWAPALHLIATPGELQDGYITESSQGNWFQRIRLLSEYAQGVSTDNVDYSTIIMQGATYNSGGTVGGAIGLLDGAYGTTYTISAIAGASGNTLTIGSTNKFRPNWWAVHNALEYGTTVRIGVSGVGFTSAASPNLNGGAGTLSPYSAAIDFAAPGLFDIVFQPYHQDNQTGMSGSDNLGWSGSTWTTFAESQNVIAITDALKTTERPVIGVVNVGLTGNVESNAKIGLPLTTPNEYIFMVAGDKYHLNSVASTVSTNLIRTPLAPDIAGCIANTGKPWLSPAGVKRGRILNVVRLGNKLTSLAQDTLYDNNVNSVISLPGSGTLLYGDITNASDTSSLVSLNVIRTIIYIRTVLQSIASAVLFEQNNADTRGSFTVQAEGILNRIKADDGLSEYSVVCDETNNVQSIIDAKAFVADISVKIPGSINYINITLTNK